jgi:hypothetical protein
MDNGENSLVGAIIDPAIIGKEELNIRPEAQIQNYPNPFTESSFISFRLKEPSDITLQLFDISGKLISSLIDAKPFSAGKHVTRIDAARQGIKPGAYIVKLSTRKAQITARILLVEK